MGNPEDWNFPPLCGEVKDGYVLGRGSVDQSGGPAAFVTAGRILKEIGLPDDVTVYFTGTVMEENFWGHFIYGILDRPIHSVIQNGDVLMNNFRITIEDSEYQKNITTQGTRLYNKMLELN